MDNITTKDYDATFITDDNGVVNSVNILIKTADFAEKINKFCGTKLIERDQELIVGMSTYKKLIK